MRVTAGFRIRERTEVSNLIGIPALTALTTHGYACDWIEYPGHVRLQ